MILRLKELNLRVTDKIDLRNCDNMELMAKYPDNYFDLAIVDPPYGIERFKKGGSVVNKYGDENRAWNNEKPTEEYFKEIGVEQPVLKKFPFAVQPHGYFIK